jgi:hypothetical protein
MHDILVCVHKHQNVRTDDNRQHLMQHDRSIYTLQVNQGTHNYTKKATNVLYRVVTAAVAAARGFNKAYDYCAMVV